MYFKKLSGKREFRENLVSDGYTYKRKWTYNLILHLDIMLVFIIIIWYNKGVSNLKTVIASQATTVYKNNIQTKIHILHISSPIWVKFRVENISTVLLIKFTLGENQCLESQASRSAQKKIECIPWTVRPTCMRLGRKCVNSDLVGDSGFSTFGTVKAIHSLRSSLNFCTYFPFFFFQIWTKLGILYLDIIILSIYEFR
jgi:hypothetical protein